MPMRVPRIAVMPNFSFKGSVRFQRGLGLWKCSVFSPFPISPAGLVLPSELHLTEAASEGSTEVTFSSHFPIQQHMF